MIVDSVVIGVLSQSSSEDWWESTPTAIPFFDGREMVITYISGDAPTERQVPAEVDQSLAAFLALTSADRLAASPLVHANCTEFLDAVEFDEDDAALWAIERPEEIWAFVHPTEIYVEKRHRRDEDIYVSIVCNCDWEGEHGLLLVYRQGRQLTRVSPQDGHMTDADAYDRPDETDTLLAAFRP